MTSSDEGETSVVSWTAHCQINEVEIDNGNRTEKDNMGDISTKVKTVNMEGDNDVCKEE